MQSAGPWKTAVKSCSLATVGVLLTRSTSRLNLSAVSRAIGFRLPAIALTTDTSALTAIGNDYGFEHIFARQVRALGRKGDVAVAISTSGRSLNVLAGAKTASECGLTTVGLTGGDTGQLAGSVNIPIVVPSTNTSRIQECHITIGHILCEMVESLLFAESSKEEMVNQISYRARSTTQ